MKYFKQFGIIIAVSFIGELLNKFVPLPVPASIYGLIIMFVCLKTGIVDLKSVEGAGKFLIEIMPLMFIPAAVGLTESWSVLSPIIIPVAVITVVTTIAVFVISGITAQMVIRRSGRKNG